MTKEEIIRELNCCDFQDKQVLYEIGVMAGGALWMQKRLLVKVESILYNALEIGDIECKDIGKLIDNIKKA